MDLSLASGRLCNTSCVRMATGLIKLSTRPGLVDIEMLGSSPNISAGHPLDFSSRTCNGTLDARKDGIPKP